MAEQDRPAGAGEDTTTPSVEQIVAVLGQAAGGDLGARVAVDPAAVSHPNALLANMLNSFLGDLADRGVAGAEGSEPPRAGADAAALARLSHELRIPLSTVIGMTTVLADGVLDPMQREAVDVIGRSAEHLLEVVDEILETRGGQTGELELELRDFDVRGLLRDTIDHAAARGVISAGVDVMADLDSVVPSRLSGDVTRLRQALGQLLDHVLRHDEPTAVRVSAGGRALDGERFELSIAVHGNGRAGVEAGDARSLPAGARRIAEAMGGDIGFDGGTGGGARVSVPLALAADAAAAVAQEPRAGKNLRVLIVEDHPLNRRVALHLVERMGHEARTATNGAEALEALELGTFDLVLMDVEMPVMDGLQATRRIRGRWLDERPVVIAMTANVMPGDRQRCLDAGMDDYIAKPIRPETLRETLERWSGGVAGAGRLTPLGALV